MTLRSLCDLSLRSLPLRSPPHLVKLTAHSVHDALSLALSSALSELSHHHSWERKKKHAEERSRVQADPPPSTETMLPSLRKDSKATESSLTAWGLITLGPHVSHAMGRISWGSFKPPGWTKQGFYHPYLWGQSLEVDLEASNFSLLITTLLRFDSHTILFTHFKVQWYFTYSELYNHQHNPFQNISIISSKPLPFRGYPQSQHY